MNKSPISFYITTKEALSLGEMHEFKNTITYENIKNLIQNLPLKDPSEIHFYKVENALIDDPWRCDDTGCIESLIWKADVMEEVKELFPKNELPEKNAPDWLIIKHLKNIAISKDSENEIITYLEHFNNKPEVQAVAIELLTPRDLSFETLVYLAASDNPGVRKALLNIRNRSTLPLVILQILSHDNNPDIEIEALDLRSENNLSPCFYPWSNKS